MGAPKYRVKPKAAPRSSATPATLILPDQQQQILNSVLEMAFQDLAPGESMEEQEQMRQDMRQNMGYYIQEHDQQIQRMAQAGEAAQHLLSNLHNFPVPEEDTEEEFYDWDTVAEFPAS